MSTEFKLAIGPVLVHEGGFVNAKNDPGGATNFGISLRWLKSQGNELNGHLAGDLDHDGDVDIDDIRKMTVNDAMAFYETHWWNPYPFSNLFSQRLATKVFDTTVNMGTRRAFTMLQKSLMVLGNRIAFDGKWGPMTTLAANQTEPIHLCQEFCRQQANFYEAIISHNPAMEEFKNGWLNRAYWY